MKILWISILLFALNFTLQADEQKKEKHIYSSKAIKELNIESVGVLIQHHSDSNGLNVPNEESVLYLVNGKLANMTTQEKDNSIIAAKTVEMLGDGNSLVINIIM